jgi:hypothetical protein
MQLTHEDLERSGITLEFLMDEYRRASGQCEVYEERWPNHFEGFGDLGGISRGPIRAIEELDWSGSRYWPKGVKNLEEFRRRLIANGFSCVYSNCLLPVVGKRAWSSDMSPGHADLVVFASPSLMLEGFNYSPFIVSGLTAGVLGGSDAAAFVDAADLGFSLIPRGCAPSWVDDIMLSEDERRGDFIAPQAVFVLRHPGRNWHGIDGRPIPEMNLARWNPHLCHEFAVGNARMHYDKQKPDNQDRIGLYIGTHKIFSPEWYGPNRSYRLGGANGYSLGSRTGHR